MISVKYSVEFNAKQIVKLIREKNLRSVALATVSRSDKAVNTFRDGLAAALSEADLGNVTVTACPDLLRRAESVLACEESDAVILVEKYGVTSHRNLDEALDLLKTQKSEVLGVIAVK